MNFTNEITHILKHDFSCSRKICRIRNRAPCLRRLIDITNVSEQSAHIQHVLYSRDSFAYLSGRAIRRNRSMKMLSRGLTPVRILKELRILKEIGNTVDSHDQRVDPLKTHRVTHHITKRASAHPKGRKGKKTGRMKKEHAEACAVAEFRARALSFSLVGFNINILKTSFVVSRQKGSSHVHNMHHYTQTFYFCILLHRVDENLSLIEDY